MAKLSKTYLWWYSRGGINLVEEASSGDYPYTTVSTAGLNIRVYAIRKASHFSSDLNENSEFPSQFHEALAYKVIADMYRLPASLNLQLAQYFDKMYEKELRNAKKYAKSQLIETGHIRGVDF